MKLIEKAQEETSRDYALKIYLGMVPRMKKIIPFNEYYENVKNSMPKKVKYDTRNKDDIMSELSEIEKSFQKGDE